MLAFNFSGYYLSPFSDVEPEKRTFFSVSCVKAHASSITVKAPVLNEGMGQETNI